ncbi:MAG TPA: APC family permease [Acidimicrobiia bacterium]|nr:APC family permease [Acidimicrobiia bacterium]
MAYSALKRLLIGRPLSTREFERQRLPKRLALGVFSTDAIASTAFATQEILVVLVPAAGMAALGYLVPISLLVVALLVIVVLSYRQTLYAYPNGGGSYIVSRENLGTNPSLVAAASLLVDYTLTVSVSVAAGVAAITSAISPLRGYEVELGVALIALIALGNLRGVRESGRVFAPPTYVYVAIMTLLVVWGLFRTFTGDLQPLPVNHAELAHFTGGETMLGGVTFFLLMRAFSSGAVALSGVEAISNGVQAFRKPESRNAAFTLMWTAFILGSLFTGIAILADQLRPTLSENETILSQMGHAVFGGSGPLYIVLQASTAAILTLSANTAYADFPRLSAIIAQDGFMPRQLANRGDRLVLSNGVLVLSIAAGGLVIGFGASVSSLIPLFAVGLFTAFTLSQAGMVVHHYRLREPRWRLGLGINGVGALATTLVTAVILISKFTEGAWIPALVIPLLVLLFKGIHRHYETVDRALRVEPGVKLPEIQHTVVVLVGPKVHLGVIQSLAYAKSLQPDFLHAVSVSYDLEQADRLREQWERFDFDVPLDVVDSPYREINEPVLEYLDQLDQRSSSDVITVIIPELVVHHWWQQLLHNQTALWLKVRLLFREGTVVTSVPSQVFDEGKLKGPIPPTTEAAQPLTPTRARPWS